MFLFLVLMSSLLVLLLLLATKASNEFELLLDLEAIYSTSLLQKNPNNFFSPLFDFQKGFASCDQCYKTLFLFSRFPTERSFIKFKTGRNLLLRGQV